MEGVRGSLRKNTQQTHSFFRRERREILESEDISLAEVAEIVRKPINVKAVDMDEICLDNVGVP